MKRRSLFRVVGLGAAFPLAAGAQPARTSARIGVLSPFSPASAEEWHRAFENSLRQLGWIPGSNITIEYRLTGGTNERLPALAAELVRAKVDLILAEVTEASWAAQKATSTIPIVMVAVGDPVAAGLVASLARPGGNITGVSQNIVESAGKRLEMLKAMIPELGDVAVLWRPEDDNSALNWREVEASAGRLDIRLTPLAASNIDDLNKVLKAESGAAWGALYVLPGPLFVTHLQMIADVARARRVPSIFHLPEFAHMGGLLAYGPDRSDLFRRAAVYVDKILKGARPSDLPVEQPTKLGLSVNLATARAIGLTVPALILARSDEVIE
jgi:putative tryptophan/tyrosine transport system substrate-binding protein